MFNRERESSAYVEQLKTTLVSLYPQLDEDNLVSFRGGEILAGSFTLKDRYAGTIAYYTLERYLHQKDPYFGERKLPGPIQTAVTTVLEALEKGQASYTLGIVTPPEYEGSPYEQLVLSSFSFPRKVGYAHPLLSALRIRRLVDTVPHPPSKPKVRNKMVREVAMEEGTVYALLAAVYTGMTEREIFKLFGNEEFRTNLYRKYGTDVLIPTYHKEQDVQAVHFLTALLQRWSYRRQARAPRGLVNHYLEAEGYMRGLGWLDFDRTFGYEVRTEHVRGIVAFAGMTQEAQGLAEEAQMPKVIRDQVIPKEFGGKVTTKVADVQLESILLED